MNFEVSIGMKKEVDDFRIKNVSGEPDVSSLISATVETSEPID
jgi:hypothetical protein